VNDGKGIFIAFALGCALGFVVAGIAGHLAYSGELESARSLAEQYRAAEQLSRERIDALESNNRRLQEHLDSAGRIVERLAESAKSNVADSRAAIVLVKEIIAQVEALDLVLRHSGPSGDSGDRLDNVDDL
jgi:hypothetical protein